MPFNGVIIVSQNPVTNWERYAQMLELSVDESALGYRGFSKEERAEGGYWRSRFRLYGPREFLTEFIRNALGRQVEIFNPDSRKNWEGFIYEMRLETGTATLRATLDTLANKVWARYQITGSGETSRSTLVEDEDSQNRYGIKEFVLGCGELESATIANQVANQILNLRKSPQPTPVAINIGKGLLPEPYIEMQCRGYIDTLWWRSYNNTGAAASQGASAQIADIIGERESVEIGYPTVWDQTFDEQIADFDAISPAWDKHFDEEIADFDATSPAWDKHATGLDADWDSETDADGDLNEAAGAAHDGAKGYEVTFDDANLARGNLALGAASATAVYSFWFNPNSFTFDADDTKIVQFATLESDDPWGQIYARLTWDGSNYHYYHTYREDGPVLTSTTPATLTDDWHHFLYYWGASTGPGNDDGYLRIYLDGALVNNITGLDNDTFNANATGTGMTYTDATVFVGSFYFDEVYIDPVGALMVNTLAAHDGAYGLMLPCGSATAKYGTLNFDAIDQTSGVFGFWIRLNDITFGVGTFNIANIEGGGTSNWYMGINKVNGDFRFEYKYRTDVAGVVFNYSAALADDTWYHVLWMWQASSAPGADDGWIRVLLNGVQEFSATGIDNDTRDGDHLIIGVTAAAAASFGGILSFDEIYLDPVGAPMVNTLAARNGTYGLMIPIVDATARYGEFTGPTNETEITIERWIHPDALAMAEGDIFAVTESLGSGAVATSVRVNLERHDGTYELSLAVYDDSSVLMTTEPIVITGTWHLIRTVLKVATGVGEDDGRAYLFIDNGKVSEIEGIDNDGYDVDSIRFGAVSGLDAGTYGLLYMDDCRWSDDAVMTVTAESGVGQFVAKSTLRTNSTLVSEIYDADRLAGDIVFDIARLGDATYKRHLIGMYDDRELIYDHAAQPERG